MPAPEPGPDHILKTTQVFIVRIWNERREKGYSPRVWRGIVEHLETREHRYFQDLDWLVKFIQEKANLPPNRWPK